MKKKQFKIVVNTYKDLIYNYAFYFINNRQETEDIVQEVLIKIWKNLNVVVNANQKAWILKTTKNLCLDQLRKRKKMNYSIDENSGQQDIFENVKLSFDSLENEIEQKDIQQIFLKILSKLPERIREILILREVMEYSYYEISESLDISLNTVKVSIHRGRKILQTLLAPILFEE